MSTRAQGGGVVVVKEAGSVHVRPGKGCVVSRSGALYTSFRGVTSRRVVFTFLYLLQYHIREYVCFSYFFQIHSSSIP